MKGMNVPLVIGKDVPIDMKYTVAVLGYTKKASDRMYHMPEWQNGPVLSPLN